MAPADLLDFAISLAGDGAAAYGDTTGVFVHHQGQSTNWPTAWMSRR